MKSFKQVGLALAVSAAFVAAPAFAGGRAELATFTNGLNSASAAFSQQVFTSQGKLKESTAGGLAMQKPRLFRWVYTKPYPQTVVADGAKIWIYEPDLKQATVRSQSAEELNSPLAVLIDPGKLDAQFNVTELPASGGLEWISLTPKKKGDTAFQSARLGLSNGQLIRLDFTDGLGQKTQITFSNWKRNLKIAPSNFKFTPPKGVDVISG